MKNMYEFYCKVSKIISVLFLEVNVKNQEDLRTAIKGFVKN